ncbi:MAG TPA: polysaccharide biosynthesis tyrosine autokinase [Chthoniobacterales bacterium]|jgi:capsular exopolysaccharide synthesis family protein|nr:polysaccharide biosynthesis tyrosine autokinase [Chthoniobacterales bacterium]
MHAPAPVTTDRPASAPWSTAFITRLHRYKALLQRRWWIPVLTICLGLFVQAWLIYQTPPSFESRSKMMLAGKLNISQSAVYSEDNINFYGTQIQLMQSHEVRRSAEQLVRSTHPEMQPVLVEISVVQKPRTSIFDLVAVGTTPDYTQAYLNAVMQKYLDYKKGMRENQGSTVTTAITEQLIQVEKDLRGAEDEMIEFQKQNNIGFIQEEGNSAAAYLVRLNQQLAQLKTEYDLLSLLDLDQNLDRLPKTEANASNAPASDDKSSGMAFSDVGPEGDYLKAKQSLQLLKAERETLSKDLRPKHPKILKLNDEITKQEKLIDLYRQDTVEKLDTRRKSIGKQMENLQANIKEWEAKALDLSQRLAQFNRIKGKAERLKTLYDRLTNSLKDVNVSQSVDSGDQVSIMEMASSPMSVRPGLLKSLLIGLGCGALAGIGILLLLDRIDDRMASFGEFQHHFSENVLGQIPKEKTKGRVTLLQPDDARHVFAESYRNVRSSLFFMPYDGPRPKTMLITSSVPNEGKSTISSNLAITMALSGARTLLIDGDLRRGALREAFGVSSKIGFSEVLKQEVNWQEVVVPTSYPNLFLIPRGKTLGQPSEHLLRESTDMLLRDMYSQYDYIIIDSSPVLAADDSTSLAPKIDATLFVVRLSYTSARLTRKSLELLYNRQVNVPGVILNYVDTSLPEYYYYQYSEYYNQPQAAEEHDDVAVSPRHHQPRQVQSS